VDVKVKDLTVRAWIADDDNECARGLMFVTDDEMKPHKDGAERGMLFVFGGDRRTGFWMRNTIIDLDIAFIRDDGTIVQTFTMAALDERTYTPKSMYRYALEVKSGVFKRHGIKHGDRVEIPKTARKRKK
jgi:uncharacterized protein